MIEEFLDGEEASFFALIDGRTCIPLASAQVNDCPCESACAWTNPAVNAA